MPFIQSNNSFDQKKWRQKNRLRAINEKLLAFPAYLLTVCVSGYRGGFKVGAFLLGLFADGVFVFFSNCACYIMFAGAFFSQEVANDNKTAAMAAIKTFFIFTRLLCK